MNYAYCDSRDPTQLAEVAIQKEVFSGGVDRIGLTLPTTWVVIGIDVGAGLNNQKGGASGSNIGLVQSRLWTFLQ